MLASSFTVSVSVITDRAENKIKLSMNQLRLNNKILIDLEQEETISALV